MKKGVAFTFGRFNPPTNGHEILINGLQELAKSGNADHFLFVSQTQNNKTDPLQWKLKNEIIQRSFPTVNLNRDCNIRTPFEALKELSKQYEDIVFFVGSDRVQEFTINMTPYALQWNVKNFAVLNAGLRDPDANDATGMSASKLREFAKQGNRQEFINGLPNRLNTALKKKVYLLTLEGLNLSGTNNASKRNSVNQGSKR